METSQAIKSFTKFEEQIGVEFNHIRMLIQVLPRLLASLPAVVLFI